MVAKQKQLLSPFQDFVRKESFGGILLVVCAAIGFAWANSPWRESYEAMKSATFGFDLEGVFSFQKDLVHWVNDGLMAIFFLLVGLEIKRELAVGELKDRRAAALPIVAAVGGMVVPALLFAAFNSGSEAIHGWAIPTATDIAFALGILALLGDRVPLGLKVFLTALAIVDDLGAVLIIALFYSHGLDLGLLAVSLGVWGVVCVYSLRGGRRLRVFLLLGIVMWYFMLQSGVHASVAGVLLALTVPRRRRMRPRAVKKEIASLFQSESFEKEEVELEHLERLIHRAHSPLHELEHSLAPWVAFLIMPIFAIFNAGFHLEGSSLLSNVALGAFVGLVLGKLVGVLGASWLAVRIGVANLPRGVGWSAMTGTSLLAGIGFTMSLFIGTLAFNGSPLLDEAKLGVLFGSVVAALVGLAMLYRVLPAKAVD